MRGSFTREFERFQAKFGARLRAMREERGLTQEQTAEMIGINWRHLQKIEAGQINVTLFTLHRCARAFGVEVPALFPPADD